MDNKYQFQDDIIEAEDRHKFGLFLDTGTGKTNTSIKFCDYYNLKGLVLIVCPKSVKQKWIDAVTEFRKGDWGCVVVTKEEFRDKYTTPAEKHTAIILDEADHFLGKSKMNKKGQKYCDKIKYVLALTASPYRSSSLNIYRLGRLLGKNWDYLKWRYKFQKERHMGGRVIWEDKHDKETVEYLKNVISELGWVVPKEEVYEVPEQLENTVYMPISSDQRDQIEAIDEVEHISWWTKRHRIEQSEKHLDTLAQHFIRKYNKIIIVARYREQIDAISEYYNTHVITGDTKNREALIKELQSTDKYIVTVQATICEGWELPDTEALIFFSHSFSFRDLKQMKGRVIRINNPSKTDIIHFLMEEGSDKDIWKALSRKEDFDISKINQK